MQIQNSNGFQTVPGFPVLFHIIDRISGQSSRRFSMFMIWNGNPNQSLIQIRWFEGNMDQVWVATFKIFILRGKTFKAPLSHLVKANGPPVMERVRMRSTNQRQGVQEGPPAGWRGSRWGGSAGEFQGHWLAYPPHPGLPSPGTETTQQRAPLVWDSPIFLRPRNIACCRSGEMEQQ